NLGWAPSSDNVGVTGYRVERCQGAGCTSFAQIGTSTPPSYSSPGLTASTSYSYRVRATDAAGNLSGYSPTASTFTSAVAAVAKVQSNYATPHSATTSVGIVYSAAQNAGDLSVVVVGWYPGAGVTVSSVTDSNKNNYVLAVGPTSAGSATQSIYYAKNIAAAAAGANIVSVTFSGSVPEADIRIQEYSGIDTVNPLDTAAGAAGSSLVANSGAIATTNANDLLVGADMILSGYAGAGPGYTARIITLPNDDLLEDQTVAATGSYSATSTQTVSGWWLMQLAAFRLAGGGGADVSPPSAPATLTATAASSAQINLGWAPSSDNVGVTGYRVERCQGAGCTSFAQIGTSTTPSYSDPGLTASTSYSYRVRATDAAGNLSGYSPTASTFTSAVAAVAKVQSNYATPHSATTSVGIVYSAAQNAGDLSVVVVGWYPGAGVTVSSVTDSNKNNYVLAVGPTSAGSATQSIYYAKNIAAAAAGANIVSVTFSGSVPEADIRIQEYSGIDTVNPL